MNVAEFVKVLVDEGFPLEDAESRIKGSIDYVSEVKETDPKLNIVDPFNEIPGIIYNLDDYQRLDDIILNSLENENLLISQSKNLFRYFDFWSTVVSDETINKVIQTLINNVSEPIVYDFALYSNKIFDDPSISRCNKGIILKQIDSFEQYIPFIASYDVNKVKNKKLFLPLKKILNLEKAIETNKIKSLKYSEGNHLYCLPGRKGHHNSLIEPHLDNGVRSETSIELYDPKFAKNDGKVTLIYFQNELIGSIKIRKNPNLIALRNIKNDQNNYPLIIGGVYGIKQQLEEEAIKSYKKQGKYAKLNLDQLEVYPIRHITQKEYIEKRTDLETYSKEIINIRKKIN